GFRDHIDAGAVNVIYGSRLVTPNGLSERGNQFLFQGGDTAVAQPRYQYSHNHFGYSLTAWNFGGGLPLFTDLAVGVPGDGLLSQGDEINICLGPLPERTGYPRPGAVEVLYSHNRFDLAAFNNQKFHLAVSGPAIGIQLSAGFAEDGDSFGATVY